MTVLTGPNANPNHNLNHNLGLLLGLLLDDPGRRLVTL